MSIDIQLPKITATDSKGQIAQIHSYLYQLAEKLNWALSLTTEQMGNVSTIVAAQNSGQASGQITEQDAINTFNAIKSLIIKSADIVEAYEQKLTLTFGSQTVALSDFGDYVDYAENYVDVTASGIMQELTDTEAIVTANANYIRNTSAYIRTGNIGPNPGGGVDQYGVEIFQQTEQSGVTVEHKLARLTASGLYFYFPSQSLTDSVASFTAQGIDLPGGHIVGGTVTGSVITGTTIQGNTITGGTISGASISGGTMDAQNMTVLNLSADQITVGSGTPTSGSVAAALADLQNQIDGAIDTWYGTGAPTLSNYPVSSWAVADYDSHIGDIYYANSDGTCYRFKKESGNYSWVVVTDTLVTQALALARDAYDLADGKRTVYYGDPPVSATLEEGDLKVVTVSGVTRTYVYDGTTWVNAADYDTTIATAVSTGISTYDASLATSGTTSIHGGNITTGTITANQIAANAITTDKLSAGAVTAAKIATGAVTADMITAGILQDATGNVFYLDLTNGVLIASFDQLSIGANPVATQSYATSAAGTAVSTYDTSLNQSAVVNKLTGGSQNEGIYLSNGHLYLNASALKTGTLDASQVTVSNLSANSITGGTINGSNVSVTNLNASNITSGTLNVDRIAAKTIVADKIADKGVTTAKLADSAVTTVKVNDQAIDSAKLKDLAVLAAKLANGAVTTDKIAANAVTAAKIAAGTITANQIQTGTLTANLFAAGQMIADNIKAGTTVTNSFTCSNLTMNGNSTVNISTSSETNDAIKLSYNEWATKMAPLGLNLKNSSTGRELILQAGGAYFYENGVAQSSWIAQSGLTCHIYSTNGVVVGGTTSWTAQSDRASVQVPSGYYIVRAEAIVNGAYEYNTFGVAIYLGTSLKQYNLLNPGRDKIADNGGCIECISFQFVQSSGGTFSAASRVDTNAGLIKLGIWAMRIG